MTVAKKIFSNTAWQLVGRAIEILIGIYTLSLLTRYLGQTHFGFYTTVTAFLQLFIIVIDFGLYLTLLKELSSEKIRSIENITNNIFTMRLLSSSVFLLLASITVWGIEYPIEIKLGVAAMAVGFLFTTLTSVLTAVFQKKLHMEKIAIANVWHKMIVLLLLILVMYARGSLQLIFYATSIAGLLQFIVVWFYLRKFINLKLAFDTVYWKAIVMKSWPIAVTIALNLIYFKADIIILSFYDSGASVGLYGAAYKVIDIISAFPHMFMGLLLPLFTAAWLINDRDRLRLLFQKAFNFFALITVPMIVGVLVIASEIMLLIAGSDFLISGSILKILILANGAIFFATLFTYVVLALDKQRAMIKYFLFVAIVALFGYLIFIPLYSYWGAAWITVLSELLVLISGWMIVRKSIDLQISYLSLLKIVLASALMGICTFFLIQSLPVIPVIISSAIIYFSLVIFFKAITWQELRQIIKTS